MTVHCGVSGATGTAQIEVNTNRMAHIKNFVKLTIHLSTTSLPSMASLVNIIQQLTHSKDYKWSLKVKFNVRTITFRYSFEYILFLQFMAIKTR